MNTFKTTQFQFLTLNIHRENSQEGSLGSSVFMHIKVPRLKYILLGRILGVKGAPGGT